MRHSSSIAVLSGDEEDLGLFIAESGLDNVSETSL